MKKIAAFFAFVMMNISALCLTVGAQDGASAKKPMLEDVMQKYGVIIFCVVGGLFLLIALISMVSFFKSTKRKYLAGLNKGESSSSKSEKSSKSDKSEHSEKSEKSEKNIYLVINGGQNPSQVQYIPVQQAVDAAEKDQDNTSIIAPVVAAASDAAQNDAKGACYADGEYVPCYCDYCVYDAYTYDFCSGCCYAYCKQEREEKAEKAAEQSAPVQPAQEPAIEELPVEPTPVKELEDEAVDAPVRELKDEGIKPEPLNPVIPVKPISPYDLMTPPADCPKCKQARDLEAENKKKKKARNIAIAVTVAAVGASALKAAVKINNSKKRNRRGKYRR